MAEDDRKRIQERREKEDEAAFKKKGLSKPGSLPGAVGSGTRESIQSLSDPTVLVKKLEELDVLIEQIDRLYQMFFTGIEKKPPLEKHSRLDAEFARLDKAPKNTPAIRFRYDGARQKYSTFTEKWRKQIERKV